MLKELKTNKNKNEDRNRRHKKKPCETLKNEKYIWNGNFTE